MRNHRKALAASVTLGLAALGGGVALAGTGANSPQNSGSDAIGCPAWEGATVGYSPTTLWPPNGKLQTITITPSENEGLWWESVWVRVDSITSTDGFVGTAANGVGNSASNSEDGSTANSTTVTVPSSRNGQDVGANTYTIHVTCADDDGYGSGDLHVTVPHDQGT